VRILFDPDQSQLAALRPGLSTTVTVRLNSEDVSPPRVGPSTPIRKAQL
jgi:multidrug resistance efflux pump